MNSAILKLNAYHEGCVPNTIYLEANCNRTVKFYQLYAYKDFWHS